MMGAKLLADGEQVLQAEPRSIDEMATDSWVPEAIAFAWDNVPFYRNLWQAAGNTSPPSLLDCPPWTVDEMRKDQEANPPYGTLYAEIGISDVRWLVTSSGTTGVPRITPQCASDLPGLRATYKRFFTMGGVVKDDIVANTFTYGPLAGCWSSTRACEEIGATLLPASNGRTTPPARLHTLIDRIELTIIIGMPSYLLHVAKLAEETGFDLASSSVRKLILAGEGSTSAAREELSERWGAETRNFYASSDVDWISMECEASAAAHGDLGSHIYPDQCVVEILGPDGTSLPPGEDGEVVITSWTRKSSPRIRYRTGDRSRLNVEPCECGRRSPRVMPISGRTDQAVRYHGVTVRPEEVEKVLNQRAGRSMQFRLRHQKGTDAASGKETMTVEIECTADELAAWTSGEIEDLLQKNLGVRPQAQLVETGALINADDALLGRKGQQIVSE